MRTKKKTVEQEKNRNSQKSVKSVQLMGMGVYGGKDFCTCSGSCSVVTIRFLAAWHKICLDVALVSVGLVLCAHICSCCYPAIRSIGGILSLLCLFSYTFMYTYGFLGRGFTDRRESLHGGSATSRTGFLLFWGVGGVAEFWASTGAIWQNMFFGKALVSFFCVVAFAVAASICHSRAIGCQGHL